MKICTDERVLAFATGMGLVALLATVLHREGIGLEVQPTAEVMLQPDTELDWREGRLLFPGLASDHAAMIRAALALFESVVIGDQADDSRPT